MCIRRTFEKKQIKNEHWKKNTKEKQTILFKSMQRIR